MSSDSDKRTILLFLVEGSNDIEFLRRVSRILHRDDQTLPDLGQWEQQEKLIFIPFGGGNPCAWVERLALLGCPEFHLYDREAGDEIVARETAAHLVNNRPNCRAVITAKRSLANYLHPSAIQKARGLKVAFTDQDDVADMVAKASFKRQYGGEPAWEHVSRRARKRLCSLAKRWLNRDAVDQMTLELLEERDPKGEIKDWLRQVSLL